ncbi:FtsX-like permease family protein [Flavihumibacter sp. R14]|nr:FtsX-like permease family protein [Flavihumibacter soli]
MLTTYFKIAIRNLKRHRLFSAINILGLTIGMATCMVIMLYVRHELSYDRFNEKADRIVRVTFRGSVQGEKMNEAHVMPPVAWTLKTDFPEVEEATRLRNGGFPRISYGEKSFREDALAYADSNIFEVFTLPLITGDPKTALRAPNSIVISKEIAEKYFGKEDPINKTLLLKDSNIGYKVTGVMENVPELSHFHFDLFASMASLPEAREASWMTSEYFTYLVLPKGYDYRTLENKLPGTVEKYMGPQLQQAMGITFSEFKQKGNKLGLFLQPLTDIHLYSGFMYDLGPRGNRQYVYIFIIIALFMLLIACINFINLSTAAASKRAREVGVRKVLGSERWQLVKQFLTESIVLTFIALAIAVIIVKICLPFFNNLSGKALDLQLTDPWLLSALLITGLLTAVLAGTYPALFLSSFQPVRVLKGAFQAGKSGISLRSGLVIVQFFVSVSLIVGTIVVYQQLRYINSKSLGYNKEQVLVLRETGLLGQKEEVFRQKLLRDSRVLSVTNSGYLPAGPTNNNNFFVYPGDGTATEQVKTLRYDVDEQYVPTLGINMLSGRNFSKDLASDSSAVIINEAAVRSFGWEKNAIGKTINAVHRNGSQGSLRVIGVVKDFHFKSLHERISPLVMVLGESDGLIVKLKTTDVEAVLQSVKVHWSELGPGEPFNYSFLDESFNNTYRFERTIGQILGIFAGLTILVACLGLFGLATFTTEQRIKEIGIRKVLGASISDIITLLSKDFLKLVLLANLLAWPLAWWGMNLWLEDFAYRIRIDWWIFIAAGFLTMLIAVLIVGIKAINAGRANPIKSLRTE